MMTHRPKWMKPIALLAIFSVFVGMLPAPKPVSASPSNDPIIVNSNGDLPDFTGGTGKCETASGNNQCTLRAAIQTAEVQSGADIITVNPLGIISPKSPLPPLGSGGTTIQGNNVFLNGLNVAASWATGFQLASNNNKIQGFYIVQFKSHGVSISEGENNVVGTDGDGVNDANEGNKIYNNGGDGVYVAGDNNRISGNMIGTNGSTGSANDHGIYIYNGTGNLIGTDGDGTSDTEERNVISGNLYDGIEIRGGDNTVAGNYIGTNAAGTSAIPNEYGVLVTNGGTHNVIGTNSDGSGDYAERNLISGNDRTGVVITGSGTNYNTVAGNYIGLDVTGGLAIPNGSNGVSVSGSSGGNTIGTNADGQYDSAECNVISGNSSDGVMIAGNGTIYNKVAGNYIGTTATGMNTLGNGGVGVAIWSEASDNTVGGTATASPNVISGNQRHGVQLYESGSSNKVLGNFIGTDKTGMGAVSNGDSGVYILRSGDNTIGGTTSAARNIISGNSGSGVMITQEESSGNVVQGNYIGVAWDGTTPLGNFFNGVALYSSAHDNVIGGVEAGAANTIAFNELDGVVVSGESTTRNAIRSNAVYSNTNIGIDLREQGSDFGPNENDDDDSDIGPNGYQNYPSLSEVYIHPLSGYLVLEGVLTSTKNTYFYVDYFLNSACDPTGYGEGQVFLDDQMLSSGSDGVSYFDRTLTDGSYQVGQFVTATATDYSGNTSEFSPCYEIVMGCDRVDDVRIVGDTSGYPGDYTFTTVITPTSATEPISYTWDNGDTASFSTRSLDVGTHVLTVTASNCGGDHTEDEHTIVIVEPPATCEVPLTGVTISGPTSGITSTTYTFSAAPEPSNATAPVTYNWTPEPDSGQGSTSASYSWYVAGEKTIAINAQNCGGARSDIYQIEIEAGTGPGPGDEYFIYLPLVVR